MALTALSSHPIVSLSVIDLVETKGREGRGMGGGVNMDC